MNILFVCQGNVNRSQMAATLLKSIAPNIEVSSAGTIVPPEREGRLVSEVSTKGVAVMREAGFDTGANVIRRLTPEMVETADKVILMGPTPGGALPEYLNTSPKLEEWDIPDPGYGHITHTEARDMILNRVQRLVLELGL